MEKGKEEEGDEVNPQSNNVTNMSTVTRDTEAEQGGDFIMNSDGAKEYLMGWDI